MVMEWWMITLDLKLSEWGQETEEAGAQQRKDLGSKKIGGKLQGPLPEMTLQGLVIKTSLKSEIWW